MTLTFDLVTWKSIGVICQSWPMSLWSFVIPGLSVLELSSGNHFTASGHCDLDLWPSDLKINRGHLPVMTNVPMKFHDPRPKRSWVIIRKPFYYFQSLLTCDLWPSDLKINRGHLPVMINVPMKFHDPRPKRSWVIIRKPCGGQTVILLELLSYAQFKGRVLHEMHASVTGNYSRSIKSHTCLRHCYFW